MEVIEWIKRLFGMGKKAATKTLAQVAEELTIQVRGLQDENTNLIKENITLRKGNERLMFKLRTREKSDDDPHESEKVCVLCDADPFVVPVQESESFFDRLRSFLISPTAKALLHQNELLRSENEDLLDELRAIKMEMTEVKKRFCFF